MATRRLLCIPYAGGGALAFRAWAAHLPAHIEAFALQLPAREDRIREPALDDWQTLLVAAACAIAPLPRMPTAIFGHSLGAVVGLGLARWMEESQPGCLLHLFAAARSWPGAPGLESDELATLPDREFLQALDRRYGSLSTSLAHPDVRAMTLPILRADLRLLASYRHTQAPPLACPLTVFAGRHDAAASGSGMEGWRQETIGPFHVQVLEAGHFFVESHCPELVAAIDAQLQ